MKRYAIHKLGDSLAGAGGVFSSDNDPELVRAAIPTSLKLIEALLAEDPKHEGLLQAANKGFAQYAYAFVQMDADELEDRDRAAAAALRDRAAKLYIRARDYGMRAFEVKHPNFAQELKANPKTAVQSLKAVEIPLMYWTAISWAGALSMSRDMFMMPQIPQFQALIERAMELDETYDKGSLHSFMVNFEMASPTSRGDKAGRAKQHYERALALGGGHQAGPYVAWAESVLVIAKDRAGFETALKSALKVDVNAEPDFRLQNLIMQRRAKWLLARIDRLFPPR